ncbi:MAG: ATP-binding protein [Pseudomonadota bacterium]
MQENVDLQWYTVPVEKLRWTCPEGQLTFECTTEIEPLKEFIGQARALDAINFGLNIDGWGYNLFLTGLTGTGKARIIKSRLERFIKEREGVDYDPKDWCYVHNFSDPDRPRTLAMKKGNGKSLRDNLDKLLKRLIEEIPKVFGNEEYAKQKQEIMEGHSKQYQESFDALDKEAREKNLMVQMSATGAAIVPLIDERPMSRQEFVSLSEEERASIEEKRREIMAKLDTTYARIREAEKSISEEMEQIDQRTGEHVISMPFGELTESYKESPEILEFLKELREYTLSNLELLTQPQTPPQIPGMPSIPVHTDPYVAYRVNLFVDNSSTSGPPIIIESNPNWFNMFGKIERKALMGTYMSDHTMIKPGAVHTANGGYLILNIRDVLLNHGVWEGLKRVVKTREIKVEDPYEQFNFFSPLGMRPQGLPVDLKIIVMGDDYLYHLLSQYDEEFWEMFKVKADFDHQVERTDENMKAYACFVRNCCDEDKLLPFDRSGVAKVMEQAARAVSDQEKLSARFGPMKDLLVEANFWAKDAKSPVVKGEHVEKAVQKKIYRLDLVAERMRKLIEEGTLMVDVEGAVVGQVNGLAVYDNGIFSFGRPSRITAKTFLGRRGVINIERESQLSGPVHDKGVFILSGYLGWKYAQTKPMGLSASICFEQSYSGVEGDSASSTELYSILSSLSEIPIRQDVAVTGSVNQKGEVQPIGGVNQKTEGFFDVCKAKGLTGNQGVLVPHQNVRNLMLREDVVRAVKEGEFNIYCVKTIDEGIEILTGRPAGKRQYDGTYPEGSVNFLVDNRLREFADTLREFQDYEFEEEKSE